MWWLAAMRISVSNWSTSDDDIFRSAEAIRSVLGKAARKGGN